MLTYALIALGGAIGSVARAWIGTAMLAFAGPSFPWGTILINVAGSFAIGLFGTLTATDGRFAVPADARAFVMVGLCGGFTTFSSFSLQTLDLLRDGRPGQALANVALSVLLCLGGVVAGHAAAMWIRTSGSVGLAAAVPSAFGDRTLVALHRPEAVRPMLAMAASLMAREADRTTALAIDGPAPGDRQPTEEVLTAERGEEMSDVRRGWVAAMRPVLDRWVVTERAEGHRARWIPVTGDGMRAITEHGRGAHLLLLEHRPDDPAGLARIRAALLHAGRPLLLVPPHPGGAVGDVVAVVWRDGAQGRRAVRAAMPILSRARRVVVLQAGASGGGGAMPPDPLDPLRVEVRTVPDRGDDRGDDAVGARLLELAREAGADLLVMGGYGGGGTVRAPFDGVTESILRSATLPVLMQPRMA